jgi:hypothetical protein
MCLFYRLISVFVLLFLIACTSQNDDALFSTTPEPGVPQFGPTEEVSYPAPTTAAGSDMSYPAPTTTNDTISSGDGRSQSALVAYEQALAVAKEEFDTDVQLYAIVPSHIMIANLGGVPVLPGWFYKFKREGSPVEFIVHISDTTLTGTKAIEPIAEVEPTERPIDMSQVNLDSTDVLEQFQTVIQTQNLSSDITYDLELVNLENTRGPVWSVVDPTTSTWIYSVDATTGEEVLNPYN